MEGRGVIVHGQANITAKPEVNGFHDETIAPKGFRNMTREL